MFFRFWKFRSLLLPTLILTSGVASADVCKAPTMIAISGKITEHVVLNLKSFEGDAREFASISINLDIPYCDMRRVYKDGVESFQPITIDYAYLIGKDGRISIKSYRVGQHLTANGSFATYSTGFGFDHYPITVFVVDQLRLD